MRILVVEDHPVELKLADHVLTAAGHAVSGARNAEEAFAAIKEARPQIVLLDVLLPGMNGLALARELKADPETCDIPIIAITSHPERFSKKDALDAGCDAYLVKPVSTRRLPQELSYVVDRGGGNPS